MSLCDPLCCGFHKVALFQCLQKTLGGKKVKTKHFVSENYRAVYNDYCVQFSFMTYENFKRNLQRVKSLFATLSKNNVQNKSAVLDVFSKKNCDACKKNQHSFTNCNGCLEDGKLKLHLAMFPVNKKLKGKAENAGLVAAKNVKKLTEQIVDNLNAEYRKEKFNTSFEASVAALLKEKSKSHVKKVERTRVIRRETKKTIEDTWAAASVERYYTYLFFTYY